MAEEARETERSGGRETLADLFVVDADVHLHEDPAELAEYAEPPWDVALREIAKVEERYLDLPAMSPRAEYRIPWPGGSNRPQVVGTAADMRRELDELHVNEAVLFPDHLLSLAMVRDPGFAVALARAYNRWLADRWLSEEPTLRGAVVIPPQDPAAGADEIRTLLLDQLRRVIIGQSEVVEQILAAIFTRGHCLLVGVPGLAKTLMVSTLASSVPTYPHPG